MSNSRRQMVGFRSVQATLGSVRELIRDGDVPRQDLFDYGHQLPGALTPFEDCGAAASLIDQGGPGSLILLQQIYGITPRPRFVRICIERRILTHLRKRAPERHNRRTA